MISSEDITREFKEILERGIQYLKNIEELIDKRTEFLNDAKGSLDVIEKMVDEQFSKVIKDTFPPVSSKISKYLEEIKPKVTKLSDAQKMISDIVNQLQTDVKFFSVKDLYKKIEELENFDFSQPIRVQPIKSQKIKSPSPSTKKVVQKETVPTLHAPVPTLPVNKVVKEAPLEEKVSEGDWSESELEGAKIFDELISGWKQRDW
ncbi:MAG: hypothetical protein HWN67_04235, partial [Candidatus Helarchaeota archaeon]|nr:hypothetical protein [Candidatus Helarchaeota archaeon]